MEGGAELEDFPSIVELKKKFTSLKRKYRAAQTPVHDTEPSRKRDAEGSTEEGTVKNARRNYDVLSV